jgi:hypothetical protein
LILMFMFSKGRERDRRASSPPTSLPVPGKIIQ